MRKIELWTINAGQHYDDVLAGQFIREFRIQFDRDITTVLKSKDPFLRTNEMIGEIGRCLSQLPWRPDWVVIFGDANATMAAAMASHQLRLPVAHVESGVRTGTRGQPEEINRIIADNVASVKFATCSEDMENLNREDLSDNAYWVGDIIRPLVNKIARKYNVRNVGSHVLSSLHHYDGDGYEPIHRLFTALNRTGRRTLFVSHPKNHEAATLAARSLNIQIVAGLSYRRMIAAIKRCAYAVTDSGAFQRECYYLRRRCVVRQDSPFWPTLVKHGVHISCEDNAENLSRAIDVVEGLLRKRARVPLVPEMGPANAGARILSVLSRLVTRPES